MSFRYVNITGLTEADPEDDTMDSVEIGCRGRKFWRVAVSSDTDPDSERSPGQDSEHVAMEIVGGIAVQVYMHNPSDGSPAYLVIEVDNDKDAPRLKLVRNDTDVYTEGDLP